MLGIEDAIKAEVVAQNAIQSLALDDPGKWWFWKRMQELAREHLEQVQVRYHLAISIGEVGPVVTDWRFESHGFSKTHLRGELFYTLRVDWDPDHKQWQGSISQNLYCRWFANFDELFEALQAVDRRWLEHIAWNKDFEVATER